MNDQSFPRQIRLRRQAEFDLVFRQNVYAADTVLVVTGRRNERPHSRLGLSVSRRVGSAVLRNRWKRLIREAFRTGRERIPVGFDFVVRPRKGAQPDLHAIARSLLKLCQRIERKS